MLVFLVPTALFGLALLVVPILLHLFKPRKVREIPFSSLRWLRASQHRLSRHIRWHQIVLFLLRAALIIFLVLALARPLISSRRSAGKSERFVVLDAGRAMRYANPDGTRPFETGRTVAEKLLIGGSVGDRTTLVLAGDDAEAVGPLLDDPSPYLALLRSVRPGLGEGNFDVILSIIPSLLKPRREGAGIDLYFVTTALSRQWTQSGISRFMKEVDSTVRVHIVNVSPDRPQNGWIADAVFTQSEQPLRRRLRVQIASAGDIEQSRTVRLMPLPGVPEMTRKVLLKPGVPVSVEFELPANAAIKGQVAQINLEPRDALENDDRYWISLGGHGTTRALVIEPETTQIPELQPGYHLRTALGALAYAEPGSLETIRRTPAGVVAEDISGADIIFMADVPALSDERLSQLEERIRNGASLAIFLGPSTAPEFYETRFFNPVRMTPSLFPAQMGELVDVRLQRGEAPGLSDIEWNHPLMDSFADPALSDLQKVHFYAYRRLTPLENRPDIRTIASIQNRAPAIIESAFGSGKVMVFNTTANDAWSDLPRRKAFVPLIDRTIRYLGGGWRSVALTVGEAAFIPLPDALPQGTAMLTTPSGQSLSPDLRRLSGRMVLRTPPLHEAGIYKVTYPAQRGSARLLFAANVNRRDSAMLPADRSILQRWWTPAEVDVKVPTLAGYSAGEEEKRLALDPFLMVLALCMFMAEMLLVHIYCPKAPPRVVVESAVARQGFFGDRQDKT